MFRVPHYDRRTGDLVSLIIDRFPEAATFDPCPCGIVFCVVEPRHVNPEIHFVVPDDRFRCIALDLLRARGLPFSAYTGPDGVLILSEAA